MYSENRKNILSNIFHACVDANGASALEFAIIAPVVLAMFFGVIGLGQIYFDRQTFQYAVEVAGRKIILSNAITQSDLTADIKKNLDTISNPDITTSYNVVSINGAQVGHLSATMNRSYVVPLITTYNMSYTADTYMPVAK